MASSSGAILPPILPLQPDAPRVLSFAQQRLWFLSQFEGVSHCRRSCHCSRMRRACCPLHNSGSGSYRSSRVSVRRAYHISGGLHLRGVLDAQALRRALDRIVARHASLRTTFALVDGQALQQIAAEESGFHLIAHELCGVPDGEEALEKL
ncbi:hypothetical protein, partial [Xanthomonas sp. MUS 060]|uniref:hypothetical protein n=1 Tax=Xanthomonas sp. MUS 060 TaxID=1588031 RepID=UPI001269A6EA